LNILYADVDGNIAYQCVGRIPIRAQGLGEAPVPGWTRGSGWLGYIPYDELPWTFNPPKGYIVTANNPPAGPTYRHLLGKELDYGYRARRIVEMIESHKGPIGVQDIEAMQADDLNSTALKALDLSPTALGQRTEDEKRKGLSEREIRDREEQEKKELSLMREARDSLAAWDGRMSGESGPAAPYAFVWVQLVSEIFRDRPDPRQGLPERLQGPRREGGEGCGQVAVGQGPHDHLCESEPGEIGYPAPRENTQVNAAAWERRKPFDVMHIPSMRLIVDLGNLGAALSVHAPGQSGHPGHRHYADFIDMWRKVQYHPALWSTGDIGRNLEGTLRLVPR